jgi:hypothetical protein
MKNQGRLTKASVGGFSASDWKSEGYSLLLSSKLLRYQWLQGRRRLIRRLRHENFGTVGHISYDLDLIDIDKSLVKSSTLLIGYAIEMFLKAGLVRSLLGCSEELFTHLSKQKFSHNYLKIAKFIHLPLDHQSQEDLKALRSAVEFDARYPITVSDSECYIDKFNERRKRLSDNARYKRYRLLANRIEQHALKLAGSPKDMLATGFIEFDVDGYLCFRRGGSMPPRITFKLGTADNRNFASLTDLKPYATSTKPDLGIIWDSAEIYEQGLRNGRIDLNKIQ